mmetsp:Transcript_26833/g.85369  ORF Transcript_26833/g.85369 Transcript_26833/m.85369 type:complete len:329 (-) Transcript_26833:620-1606(-)
MSDHEQGRAAKATPDALLNEAIGLLVEGGRRLVQHNDLGATQDRTSDACQLPLADAEVLPALRDLRLEPVWERFDSLPQVGLVHRLPNLFVGVAVERIEVLPHGRSEQDWVLRDAGDGQAEFLHRYPRDIHAINLHRPGGDRREAKQCSHKGALPAPGFSYNPHLCPCGDVQSDIANGRLEICAVPKRDIVEDDVTARRPAFWSFLCALVHDRFVFKFSVLHDPLHRVHLRFHLRRHSHGHVQVDDDVERVSESEAGQARSRIGRYNGDCRGEHNKRAEKFETHREPDLDHFHCKEGAVVEADESRGNPEPGHRAPVRLESGHPLQRF